VIRNTRYPFGENTAMEAVDEVQRRSRGNGMREYLLTALVLYSLAPDHASASDSPQSPDGRRITVAQPVAHAQIVAPSYPAPFAFVPPPEARTFSPTEFRARKPGLLGATVTADQAFAMDAPMLRDTSIARGLSEAKSQDRVRLLTLWQTRASSLSLQAGKRGAPSLQWSTPWMHRDAASRGLFDRWLAVSPRSFGSTVRGGVPHQAGAIAPAKTLESGGPINTK
jgi:hypothetical protein